MIFLLENVTLAMQRSNQSLKAPYGLGHTTLRSTSPLAQCYTFQSIAKILSVKFVLALLLLASTSLQASIIDSITSTPVNALDTDPINISVSGYTPQTNVSLLEKTISLVGKELIINLHYSSAGVGLTVITNYSEVFSAGQLKPGNYTIVANAYVNGTLTSRQTKNLLVSSSESLPRPVVPDATYLLLL